MSTIKWDTNAFRIVLKEVENMDFYSLWKLPAANSISWEELFWALEWWAILQEMFSKSLSKTEGIIENLKKGEKVLTTQKLKNKGVFSSFKNLVQYINE